MPPKDRRVDSRVRKAIAGAETPKEKKRSSKGGSDSKLKTGMKSRTAAVLLLWKFLCISLLSSQFTIISLFSLYGSVCGGGGRALKSLFLLSIFFLKNTPKLSFVP